MQWGIHHGLPGRCDLSVPDMRLRLGPDLEAALDAATREWADAGGVRRLWDRDAGLWTGGDESRWLGWLDLPSAPPDLHRLDALRRGAGDAGFRHLLLLGMGGSSLASEVLGLTLSGPAGAPALHVLDSTDPAQIRRVEHALDLSRTLCLVSSKSGTTLESTLLTEYFLDRLRDLVGAAEAGARFVAITDPGSALETMAQRLRFRAVLPGVPSVGGRFSALSNFGLAPAALCGLDVRTLLARAATMADRCRPEVAAERNPGLRLGLILGVAARQGRDKLTLCLPPAIDSLGSWLEQLLAESTGKAGQGVIPVAGETVGQPMSYGSDRLFVSLQVAAEPNPEQTAAVAVLAAAGQPVVEVTLADRFDVGAEFVRWQIATAVCGAVLGVHPFDQPDVEASKLVTRNLAAAYAAAGALPPETPLAVDDALAVYADPATGTILHEAAGERAGVSGLIRAHLARLRPGDYFALLAYLDRSPACAALLRRLREEVRERYRAATSLGFGPRFLHSTGQAFKGGPNSGVFLQITCDDAADLPVPGRAYTFGVIKAAQARGDLQVLVTRRRRVLRVHLGPDVVAGLERLTSLVRAAG